MISKDLVKSAIERTKKEKLQIDQKPNESTVNSCVIDTTSWDDNVIASTKSQSLIPDPVKMLTK